MNHPSPSHLHRGFRTGVLLKLSALMMLAGLVFPLMASPAAAQTALPENVLQSSVRMQIVIEVTPDDRDESPFLCTAPDDEVLEFGNGSGTLISEDGYILTNHHVAEPPDVPDEIVSYCSDQIPGGGEVAASMLVWTPDENGRPETAYKVELVEDSSLVQDMAVFKITEHADGSRVNTRQTPFPFVTFGDSSALREPEQITVIGYPGNAGPDRRVSIGIFSGLGDNGFGVDWIYTDATISGGNSGGTAVNSQGYFIGIPSQATASDCRAGDTNQDGTVDEKDGCIGIGGNYGIIIPSNIARKFAEKATGLTFDVATSETPSTPEIEPTDEPVNTATPLVENIEFIGMDDEGNVIDDFTDIRRLEACFDSTIPDGSVLEVTWFLDGDSYFVTELEWLDAYNPNGCVSIFLNEDATIPFLEPGVYTTQIVVEGETYTSGEVEVFRSTGDSNVESVAISGRTTDRETIDAVDGVLQGEFSTLTIDVEFVGMETGDSWQVELYLDGDLVIASDGEIWEDEAAGSSSVRLRPADRGPFEPGVYEVVVNVNGTEASTTTLEIVN